MNQTDLNTLQTIAHTLRGLSIDAILAANSGHPGLPLGCAEWGAYLYGHALTQYPKDPNWSQRDRFILSAGHGSALLYSCLHLAGFELSLEELKNFRQLHSKTAGHPEYLELPGVETTTGPLGQGFATGIGIALGEKITESKTGFKKDSHIIILAGDGCFMEGISAEASALAGHLGLDNIIVIYDSNDICLDGPTSETHTEDTQKRYESYGWKVFTVDGHNLEEIDKIYTKAKAHTGTPKLIISKTIIGKGSPKYQGTSDVHGKPLDQDEINAVKKGIGLKEDPFYIPESVKNHFESHLKTQEKIYQEALKREKELKSKNKELWSKLEDTQLPKDLETDLETLTIKENLASRASSQEVLQSLHQWIPALIGGSADLSCSDSTLLKNTGIISKENFSGKNIKYGVREFAMAAIASGLRLQGNLIPFCGTFLTFSDYMKNAIRLAALMNLKVVYQFTHDSIFLGEDGPTHQPVEHLASLRSIPNLTVIRPADSTEVKAAWYMALKNEGPTALILSRQSLKEIPSTSFKNAQKGAYAVKENENPDYIILSTGSEVNLALAVAEELESKNKKTKVISFLSWEIFEKQDKTYKNTLLPKKGQYIVIEAQSSFGWHKYTGRDGIMITVDTFGKSAPIKDLEKEYGFTKEACVKKILS